MKKLLMIFLLASFPAIAEEKSADEGNSIDTNISGYLDQNPSYTRDYSSQDYYYSQQEKLMLEPEFRYVENDDPTRGGGGFEDREKEFKLKMNFELE